jgi:hypothetical protein
VLALEVARANLANMPLVISIFNEKGKSGLMDALKEKGLFVDPRQIMREISASFPEDLQSFPHKLKDLFLGLT